MDARTRGGAVLRVLFLAVLALGGFAAYRFINRPDPAADAGKVLEDLRAAALKNDVATCWAAASPELQEEAVVRAKALATCDPLRGKAPELLQVNLRLVKFPVPTVKLPCATFGDTRICKNGATWQLAALAFNRVDTPASDCAAEPKSEVTLEIVPATATDAGTSGATDAELLKVAFPQAEKDELGAGIYLVTSAVQRYQDDVAFIGVITAGLPKPSSGKPAALALLTSDYCRQQPFAAELIGLRKGDEGWQVVGRVPLADPPHGSACPSVDLKLESPHLTDEMVSVLASVSVQKEGADAPESKVLLAALHADDLGELFEYSQSAKESVALGTEPSDSLPDLELKRTDTFDGTSHVEHFRWNGQKYEQLSNPIADEPIIDPGVDDDSSPGN